MIVYGIKSCDTVKKTTDWLKSKNKAFEFHDYKAQGISKEALQNWISQIGWEPLVNKKGTTWRDLDDATKKSITDANSAIALMMEKTSVIKRPVIENNGKVLAVGFNEAEYAGKI